MVENIIVIEVEVDELHEGKTLSRPSTSITISAVAQENKKNNERLRAGEDEGFKVFTTVRRIEHTNIHTQPSLFF